MILLSHECYQGFRDCMLLFFDGAVSCWGESLVQSPHHRLVLASSMQVIPAQLEQLCCSPLPTLPVTAGKLPSVYYRTLLAQPGWAFVGVFCYSDVVSRGMWENSSILPDTHSLKGKGIWVVLTVQWGTRHTKQHRIKDFYLQTWLDQLV